MAKKGIFNVNPQLFKSQADINAALSGELKTKFSIALREFAKLGIRKGVYQGDLMFTKGDVKVATVAGEKYYTFQPNTIVYAVPVKSNLGAQIKRASIGVVWHTTYEGREISKMKASFGKDIVKKFRKSNSIWMDDATYRDVSGNATFTAKETEEVTALLSQAGKRFNTIDGDVLRTIRDDDELKQKIKTYNNTFVRAGEPFPDVDSHVKGLYQYIMDWYQKEIDKRKSEKGKQTQRDALSKVLEFFSRENKRSLKKMFDLQKAIVSAKLMLINKMNSIKRVKTFLQTTNGFRSTEPEGYVAIDKLGDNAVKLVNRYEFSTNNFDPTILKGWSK